MSKFCSSLVLEDFLRIGEFRITFPFVVRLCPVKGPRLALQFPQQPGGGAPAQPKGCLPSAPSAGTWLSLHPLQPACWPLSPAFQADPTGPWAQPAPQKAQGLCFSDLLAGKLRVAFPAGHKFKTCGLSTRQISGNFYF